MGVHRRRGHADAEKEVNRETWLGVTDPSGHARGPNLSLVRLAEENECGERSGVNPRCYLEIEVRKWKIVARSTEQPPSHKATARPAFGNYGAAGKKPRRQARNQRTEAAHFSRMLSELGVEIVSEIRTRGQI